MLDLKFIRENAGAVKHAIKVKGITLDLDELLALSHSEQTLGEPTDPEQAGR